MHRLLRWIEAFIAILALALAIRWVRDPSSNSEAYLALVTAVGMGIELFRRHTESTTESDASVVAELPVPAPEAPPTKIEEDESLSASEGSRAVFARRFGYAFPSIREITWFESSVAIGRLNVLLAKPLKYSSEAQRAPPIWWWRFGNLQIESFRQLDARTVLMNSEELRIRRIAAAPNADYKRRWVYVEAESMPSTGLYQPLSEVDLAYRTERFGYAWEEYALYRGQMISREAYDDGAALIGGSLVRLNGEAEPRTRYITPYNCVIAAFASPFNNNSFDRILGECLNGMLRGDRSIEDLELLVQDLPIPSRFDDRE